MFCFIPEGSAYAPLEGLPGLSICTGESRNWICPQMYRSCPLGARGITNEFHVLGKIPLCLLSRGHAECWDESGGEGEWFYLPQLSPRLASMARWYRIVCHGKEWWRQVAPIWHPLSVSTWGSYASCLTPLPSSTTALSYGRPESSMGFLNIEERSLFCSDLALEGAE